MISILFCELLMTGSHELLIRHKASPLFKYAGSSFIPVFPGDILGMLVGMLPVVIKNSFRIFVLSHQAIPGIPPVGNTFYNIVMRIFLRCFLICDYAYAFFIYIDSGLFIPSHGIAAFRAYIRTVF